MKFVRRCYIICIYLCVCVCLSISIWNSKKFFHWNARSFFFIALYMERRVWIVLFSIEWFFIVFEIKIDFFSTFINMKRIFSERTGLIFIRSRIPAQKCIIPVLFSEIFSIFQKLITYLHNCFLVKFHPTMGTPHNKVS